MIRENMENSIMIIILMILLLSTSSGLGSASDKEKEKEAKRQETTNLMVDGVLEDVKQRPNFDPMKLLPPCSPLYRTIPLGPVNMTMHHNVVYGMRSLHRNGNAKIENIDGKFLAETNLTSENLTLHTVATVQGSMFKPEMKMKARIERMDYRFDVEVVFGERATLRRFSIESIVGMDIDVEDSPVTKGVLNIFTGISMSLFDSALREKLTNMLRPVIECKLKDYKSS